MQEDNLGRMMQMDAKIIEMEETGRDANTIIKDLRNKCRGQETRIDIQDSALKGA